jgi:hypothetical protein
MSLSCTAGPRKRTAKKASMTCTDQGLRSAFAGSRPGGLTGTYSAIWLYGPDENLAQQLPLGCKRANDLQLWKLVKERKVESGLAQEAVEQAGLGSI